MADVVRFDPGSADLEWASSARERAVAREGRVIRRAIQEKVAATALAVHLEADLLRFCRATFSKTHTDILAAEDEITDPRSRAVMETFDKEMLEYHKQHQVGLWRLAGEEFAKLVSRDIIPEKPPTPKPDTFLQQLMMEITRG